MRTFFLIPSVHDQKQIVCAICARKIDQARYQKEASFTILLIILTIVLLYKTFF